MTAQCYIKEKYEDSKEKVINKKQNLQLEEKDNQVPLMGYL